MDIKQLVSIGHAAARCGITRRAIYHHLKAGTGPEVAAVIDGRRYFDREKLYEWNKARKAARKRAPGLPAGGAA